MSAELQSPTELFISHISEEHDLAAMLKWMLENDFGTDRLQVFASSDIGSIEAGDDWLQSVHQAMDRAAAVLVLCSKASVHRPWVQFEIGAAWMKQVPIVPVCHSDMKVGDLPIPLSLRQGVDAGEESGLKRLYLAVSKVLKAGPIPAPPVSEMAARLANIQVLENRYRLRVQQFERYIDVIVPAPGRLESPTIPDHAEIETDAQSLDLFGYLEGPQRTWRDIVKAARKTPDTRWVKQLQRCIYQAGMDEQFDPVQAVYHTGHGSYQPQLAKKEMLADGRCRFHVHLVETVVAPLSEVDNEFGLLATLLRLGLRFRYEVIERYARLKKVRGPGGALLALPEIVQTLREAVEVIENDALSRGAQNFDPVTVVALFDREKDQAEMEAIQGDWASARAQMFRAEPALSAKETGDLIDAMRGLNYRFMKLGTRRFHEMVGTRWVPEPAPRRRSPEAAETGQRQAQSPPAY